MTMKRTILSCKREVFRGKEGEGNKEMYRLYFAADDGAVGYIYSSTAANVGDIAVLGLREREGKLFLRFVGVAN